MHAALQAVLFVATVSSAAGRSRHFVIDLDLPPLERWRKVVQEYRDILPSMLVGLELQLRPTMPQPQEGHVENVVSLQPDSVPENWWLRHHNIKPEYLAELIGIVRLAANEQVTLRRLINFQMMHEIWKGSPDTIGYHSVGVLAGDTNGTVIHGWNVEYNFNFIALGKRMSMADVALELVFKRGRKKVFSGTGFPGRVGLLGGKGHHLSLQALPSPSTLSASAVSDDFSGGAPVEMVVRDTLSTSQTFSSAVKYLERSQLHAPAAFMLAGGNAWEGALVDKAALDPAAVTTTALNPQVGQWFMVRGCSSALEPECKEIVQGLGQEDMSTASVLKALRTRPLFGADTLLSRVDIPLHGNHRRSDALLLAKEELVDQAGRLSRPGFE